MFSVFHCVYFNQFAGRDPTSSKNENTLALAHAPYIVTPSGRPLHPLPPMAWNDVMLCRDMNININIWFGSAVEVLTDRLRHTDMTDFIPSTADVGGKNEAKVSFTILLSNTQFLLNNSYFVTTLI